MDFTTPCDPPPGGWETQASAGEIGSGELSQAARGRANFAGMWLDAFSGVANVATTGDVRQVDAELRRSFNGRLCVVPAKHTLAELLAVQEELPTVGWPESGVLSTSINEVKNVVEVTVTVADRATVQELHRRFGGDRLDITGWLQPVEPAR